MAHPTPRTSAPPALNLLIPDPADLQPICGREEFTALLRGIVTDTAPRLFAVVQEYGDRVDGRVAAWGMAFEEHADVISVEGHRRTRAASPEQALRAYRLGTRAVPRLMWP
ncbi:hypothetical protein AB0P17_08050 [Streptomyces sp. NPDC088124]|uniref:hypothetical protein n=1 Tax=Streptomyces sp. NPDC088124 TaxID=3154654 RepID=UPI00343B75FE